MVLKAKTVIAYPGDELVFNFSVCWRSCIINITHSSILFLPVGILESFEWFVKDDGISIHRFTSTPTVGVELFDLLRSDS